MIPRHLVAVTIAAVLPAGMVTALHRADTNTMHRWRHIANESVDLNDQTLNQLGECVTSLEHAKT